VLGHDVVFASTAGQAQEILEQEDAEEGGFDVILLDMQVRRRKGHITHRGR